MPTDNQIRTLALALHVAFDDSEWGVGRELNCFQHFDDDNMKPPPGPGIACWELAATILSTIEGTAP